MATTYTIHTTGCASAIELEAPIVNSADYPTARKHKCVYSVTPVPAQVRVTSTDEVVPVASKKKK